MKIVRQVKPLQFQDGDSSVTIQYDNEGEPFREGVAITFVNANYPLNAHILLDVEDVQRLMAKLGEFLARSR